MRPTILVVDEMREHRDIVARMLRSAGFCVFETAPDYDAPEYAEHILPDVIVIGLSLPGHRGWETARRLSRSERLRHTPLLGASPYPTTMLTRQRASIAGCSDYIDKPFDLDALVASVQSLIAI